MTGFGIAQTNTSSNSVTSGSLGGAETTASTREGQASSAGIVSSFSHAQAAGQQDVAQVGARDLVGKVKLSLPARIARWFKDGPLHMRRTGGLPSQVKTAIDGQYLYYKNTELAHMVRDSKWPRTDEQIEQDQSDLRWLRRHDFANDEDYERERARLTRQLEGFLPKEEVRERLPRLLQERMRYGKDCLLAALDKSKSYSPDPFKVDDIADIMLYLEGKNRLREDSPQSSSFVIEDPQGKLYHCLESCEEKYLRPSSHLKDTQLQSTVERRGPHRDIEPHANVHRGVDISDNPIFGLPGGKRSVSFAYIAAKHDEQGNVIVPRRVFIKAENHGCRLNSLSARAREAGRSMLSSRPWHVSDIFGAIRNAFSRSESTSARKGSEYLPKPVIKAYQSIEKGALAAGLGDDVLSAIRANDPTKPSQGISTMMANLKSAYHKIPADASQAKEAFAKSISDFVETLSDKISDVHNMGGRIANEVIYTMSDFQTKGPVPEAPDKRMAILASMFGVQSFTDSTVKALKEEYGPTGQVQILMALEGLKGSASTLSQASFTGSHSSEELGHFLKDLYKARDSQITDAYVNKGNTSWNLMNMAIEFYAQKPLIARKAIESLEQKLGLAESVQATIPFMRDLNSLEKLYCLHAVGIGRLHKLDQSFGFFSGQGRDQEVYDALNRARDIMRESKRIPIENMVAQLHGYTLSQERLDALHQHYQGADATAFVHRLSYLGQKTLLDGAGGSLESSALATRDTSAYAAKMASLCGQAFFKTRTESLSQLPPDLALPENADDAKRRHLLLDMSLSQFVTPEVKDALVGDFLAEQCKGGQLQLADAGHRLALNAKEKFLLAANFDKLRFLAEGIREGKPEAFSEFLTIMGHEQFLTGDDKVHPSKIFMALHPQGLAKLASLGDAVFADIESTFTPQEQMLVLHGFVNMKEPLEALKGEIEKAEPDGIALAKHFNAFTESVVKSTGAPFIVDAQKKVIQSYLLQEGLQVHTSSEVKDTLASTLEAKFAQTIKNSFAVYCLENLSPMEKLPCLIAMTRVRSDITQMQRDRRTISSNEFASFSHILQTGADTITDEAKRPSVVHMYTQIAGVAFDANLMAQMYQVRATSSDMRPEDELMVFYALSTLRPHINTLNYAGRVPQQSDMDKFLIALNGMNLPSEFHQSIMKVLLGSISPERTMALCGMLKDSAGLTKLMKYQGVPYCFEGLAAKEELLCLLSSYKIYQKLVPSELQKIEQVEEAIPMSRAAIRVARKKEAQAKEPGFFKSLGLGLGKKTQVKEAPIPKRDRDYTRSVLLPSRAVERLPKQELLQFYQDLEASTKGLDPSVRPHLAFAHVLGEAFTQEAVDAVPGASEEERFLNIYVMSKVKAVSQAFCDEYVKQKTKRRKIDVEEPFFKHHARGFAKTLNSLLHDYLGGGQDARPRDEQIAEVSAKMEQLVDATLKQYSKGLTPEEIASLRQIVMKS